MAFTGFTSLWPPKQVPEKDERLSAKLGPCPIGFAIRPKANTTPALPRRPKPWTVDPYLTNEILSTFKHPYEWCLRTPGKPVRVEIDLHSQNLHSFAQVAVFEYNHRYFKYSFKDGLKLVKVKNGFVTADDGFLYNLTFDAKFGADGEELDTRTYQAEVMLKSFCREVLSFKLIACDGQGTEECFWTEESIACIVENDMGFPLVKKVRPNQDLANSDGERDEKKKMILAADKMKPTPVPTTVKHPDAYSDFLSHPEFHRDPFKSLPPCFLSNQ